MSTTPTLPAQDKQNVTNSVPPVLTTGVIAAKEVTFTAPAGITTRQHLIAAAGIFAWIFITNYVTTPSASSFLDTHVWLADLVGCFMTTMHVYQTYRSK